MIVKVSEVTPSVCINARSTNSPTQKPVTAPSVEPHNNPTNATSSGVRSTLTPNSGTSETTLIWMKTTITDSTATRHTSEPGSQAVPPSGLARRVVAIDVAPCLPASEPLISRLLPPAPPGRSEILLLGRADGSVSSWQLHC